MIRRVVDATAGVFAFVELYIFLCFRVPYILYLSPLIASPSILVGRAPLLSRPSDDPADSLALEKNLVKLVALPILGLTADPSPGVVAALSGPPGLSVRDDRAPCDCALNVDIELLVRLCPGLMTADRGRDAAVSGVLGRMYD